MGLLGWASFFAWRNSRGREKALEKALQHSRDTMFCCCCCDYCGSCATPDEFCPDCHIRDCTPNNRCKY